MLTRKKNNIGSTLFIGGITATALSLSAILSLLFMPFNNYAAGMIFLIMAFFFVTGIFTLLFSWIQFSRVKSQHQPNQA
jgi:hypothetical protein